MSKNKDLPPPPTLRKLHQLLTSLPSLPLNSPPTAVSRLTNLLPSMTPVKLLRPSLCQRLTSSRRTSSTPSTSSSTPTPTATATTCQRDQTVSPALMSSMLSHTVTSNPQVSTRDTDTDTLRNSPLQKVSTIQSSNLTKVMMNTHTTSKSSSLTPSKDSSTWFRHAEMTSRPSLTKPSLTPPTERLVLTKLCGMRVKPPELSNKTSLTPPELNSQAPTTPRTPLSLPPPRLLLMPSTLRLLPPSKRSTDGTMTESHGLAPSMTNTSEPTSSTILRMPDHLLSLTSRPAQLLPRKLWTP